MGDSTDPTLPAVAPDSEREAHFWAAVYEGDVDYIRLFLLGDEDSEPEPGITLELPDARGLPILHRLAVIGHLEALRFLLNEAGADVNQRETAYGQTALHLAASKGHVEVVELLLGAGADCLALDNAGGWSAVHAAARGGHDETIAFLLERGPVDYVNTRAANGDTPLHRAAYWGHVSTVRTLLHAGGNRLLRNAEGKDVLALACRGPGVAMLGVANMRFDLLQPPSAPLAATPRSAPAPAAFTPAVTASFAATKA
jgi:hypothetical protein